MSLTHAYPIDRIIPEVRQALTQHPLTFLTAEPGAGKTTRLPLSLLEEAWLGPRKIIILEPRRLAARASARHMANLLGEEPGETVGYRTRLDSQVGPRTRLEVVTEGILTRILQRDPALTDYGLVVFDEFHERHLQSDLGFVLSLDTQTVLRPDLRILIMSATLDRQTLSQRFPQAPFLTCEGQRFPVEIRHLDSLEPQRFPQEIGKLIHRLLLTENGNLLVFLPGAGEIRGVTKALSELPLDSTILIVPLFGNLSPKAQDQAILPPPHGFRKVVLATNIAETSLTIEGVRIVIDSGLVRIPRFDPRSGMTRLTTTSISRESAEQRRGRAGRLESGLCIRCWPETRHRSLPRRLPPEIFESDLTPMALELARWGSANPDDLQWLDPPPLGALAHAYSLLQDLGALDEHKRITPHGREMAHLPMHPRLGHMILQAKSRPNKVLGCHLAALLTERDALRGSSLYDQPDLRLFLDAFFQHLGQSTPRGFGRIRKVSEGLQRDLGLSDTPSASMAQETAIGVLLGWAYPDRIAKRESDGSGRYRLANGRRARFSQPNPIDQEPWLVIADLDGATSTSKIFLAAPLREDDLFKHFSTHIRVQDEVKWDAESKRVIARKVRRFGLIPLQEIPLTHPNPELCLKELLMGIRTEGSSCLPWTKTLRQYQDRIQFLHRILKSEPPWPDVSDDTLMMSLESWLAPYLTSLTSLAQVQEVNLNWPLQSLLTEEQRRSLDCLAPTHLTVPTGSRIALDYHHGETPILPVRLQETFGMATTPKIVDGRIPVLLHLLSPAGRPVQITHDLASFWVNGYPEVKKELKGRYPKHFWPDDPLNAPPTSHSKKRRT